MMKMESLSRRGQGAYVRMESSGLRLGAQVSTTEPALSMPCLCFLSDDDVLDGSLLTLLPCVWRFRSAGTQWESTTADICQVRCGRKSRAPTDAAPTPGLGPGRPSPGPRDSILPFL